MLGDATGLAIWAIASMLGVSALVVVSEAAYTALKVVGAIVLIAYGVEAIGRARREEPAADRNDRPRSAAPSDSGSSPASTSPKVGLFYVALLPQFVPEGTPVLAATLLLAAIQISLACAWYFVLATAVGRTREAFARRRAQIEDRSPAR